MYERTLLIGFLSFAVFLLIVAVIIRRASVQDIFKDEKPYSSLGQASPPLSTQQNTQIGRAQEKKPLKLDRKTLNNIGKICGAVGVIMLFSPLSESFNGLAFGLAAIGYLLVKATAPQKGKNKNNTKKENPVACGLSL